MARQPRLSFPNIPQHVIQRGNNRQACFHLSRDYYVYLNKLKDYADEFHVAIHSYVLMTNHVHILLTPETKNGVSNLMQSLGRYYVRYFNKSHLRTGTLWEGRFKSILVDSDNYFLTLSRYIELNPVRAGMVEHPSDYKWSSYKANAMGQSQKLLTKHDCYQALGKSNCDKISAYRGLFNCELTDKTLGEIRDSINKSSVLGDERFISEIEKSAGRRVVLLKQGGDRKSRLYRQNQVI